jgi:putative aminopeptidase FrvX
MNKKLYSDLCELVLVQTISRKTENMRAHIHAYVEGLKDPTISIIEDKENNIYIVKGDGVLVDNKPYYPCVVAHTDTVHTMVKHPAVYSCGDNLFAFDAENMCQIGTGGDDKVGIFIALWLLQTCSSIKIAFFVDEEIGCKGSGQADMKWFDNVTLVLQADRQRALDVVRNAGGTELFNEAFEKALKPIMKEYDRKIEHGLYTDVKALADQKLPVCCMNMSCGYYNPHTSKEYINVVEVEATYKFMLDIIKTIGNRTWPIERKTAKYSGATVTHYSGGSNGGAFGRSWPPEMLGAPLEGYRYDSRKKLWVPTSKRAPQGYVHDKVFRTQAFDFCEECGKVLATKKEFEWGVCANCFEQAIGTSGEAVPF